MFVTIKSSCDNEKSVFLQFISFSKLFSHTTNKNFETIQTNTKALKRLYSKQIKAKLILNAVKQH